MSSGRLTAIVTLAVLLVAGALYGLSGFYGDSDERPESAAVAAGQPADTRDEDAGPGEAVEAPAVAPGDREYRIYGTVTDAASGAAVANARIILRMEAAEPSTIEYSDDDGSFSVTSDRAPEMVICRADGFAEMSQPFRAAGTSQRLDFPLLRSATVSGRVTDSMGEPVAGIGIALESGDGAVQRRRGRDDAPRATTDEDGAYRIDGIEAGRYVLAVRAREGGFLQDDSTRRDVTLRAGDSLTDQDFQLDTGGTVHGIVRDPAGANLSGARVQVRLSRMLEEMSRDGFLTGMERHAPLSGITNADGRYEVRGLELDKEYVIDVSHASHAPASSAPTALTSSARVAQVDLTLTRGSMISGRAVYEDGSPAAGRRVALMPSEEGFAGIFGMNSVTTETDGAFVFDHVAKGEYIPMAFGAAPGDTGNQRVRADGESALTDIEIIVPDDQGGPGADGAILGVVFDERGRPVEGARVAARQAMGMGGTRTAETDAAGRFVLSDLRGGMFDIEATKDTLRASARAVMLGTEVSLTLAEPAAVSGMVMSAAGHAVANAEVRLRRLSNEPDGMAGMRASMERMFGGRRGAERSDINGFFRFDPVEPGDYVVEVSTALEGTGESRAFYVAAGQSYSDVLVRLTPGVMVSGTVSGTGSGLLSNARVTLSPMADDDFTSMMSAFMPSGAGAGSSSGSTDDRGRFTIEDVAPGTYTLTATHRDFAKTIVDGISVQAGRDVSNLSIVMPRSGQATGAYQPGGVAKPGVMINIIGPSGMYMAMTDANGHFSIEGLPPGSYMISAVDMATMGADGLGGLQQNMEVIDITEGGVTELNLGNRQGTSVSGAIDLAPGSMTTVSIRRPGGPGIEDFNLSNMRQAIEFMRYQVGQAIVQPDGSFLIDGVPPGTYLMDVFSIDFDPSSGDISQLMNFGSLPHVTHEIVVGQDPVYQVIQWPQQ